MRPKKDSEPDESAETFSTLAQSCDAATLRNRKHYDATFKLHAILKLLRGEKQTHVGLELGVSQPLLSIWKRRALAALYREFDVAPGEAVKPQSALPSRRRR